MADNGLLKNNKNIYKEAEDSYNKMQHDVIKFCLELGWQCWVEGKEITKKETNA